MNHTPSANRLHIAFFGDTNAGKSSLINALTNQDIALVSSVSGTTTDPVYKSMEILPLGPCMLVDTAGLNDDSELGNLRHKKTMDVMNKCDVAIVVAEENSKSTNYSELIQNLKEKKIPIIGVLNKSDLIVSNTKDIIKKYSKEFGIPFTPVSCLKNTGINALKEMLIKYVPVDDDAKFRIVGDLIDPLDLVVLVTPIDSAAPKGRIILPQQQTVRDILENDAISIVTKEHQLKETLASLKKKPRMVITDSQAFEQVAKDTPSDIPLTSFSILFARNKGDLNTLVEGAAALHNLKEGDKVLISEGCTHHTQCDDIGTVKIPKWLKKANGFDIDFDKTSGVSFKEDLSKYKLIIHCGACMLTQKAMEFRIEQAKKANVPIVNYGVLIAYLHGILDRALEPFPQAKHTWDTLKNS